MCSIEQLRALPVDVAPVPPGQPWDDVAEDVWESLVAESRAAAERHPWGRFVRLYGDEPAPFGSLAPPLSDEELLRRMADAEALVAQVTARQGRDLLELRSRRVNEQSHASRPS